MILYYNRFLPFLMKDLLYDSSYFLIFYLIVTYITVNWRSKSPTQITGSTNIRM